MMDGYFTVRVETEIHMLPTHRFAGVAAGEACVGCATAPGVVFGYELLHIGRGLAEARAEERWLPLRCRAPQGEQSLPR